LSTDEVKVNIVHAAVGGITESDVNLALASSPATIMCSYDGRSLPEEVLVGARRTHPEVAGAGDVTASPAYREPADFLLGMG
jgi:hypothetical protein